MRIIDLPAGGPHLTAPIVIDGGFAAVHGASFCVFDIRGAAVRAVLELPDILAATAAGRILMTLDNQGLVTRWGFNGDRWTATARSAGIAVAGDPELRSSQSGRFAFVDGAHGLLVDLEGERIVTELDASYGTARPCFERLPDGREVLFVAAPGYMSVRMIDAETGTRRGEYEEKTSWDFCHVRFRLTTDGARLVTFGCVWAWPYEVRIYEATPWTAAGRPLAQGFPLPLLRTIEPIASNTLLAAHVDGNEITSAGIEQRADLVPDEDGELPAALDRLRGEDPEVAAQLDRVSGDDPCVLIARRIDPRDGRTVSSAVHAIPAVDEREVHYLDDHQVVVAGPRLLVCNALDDRRVDHGELRVPGPGTTAVTRDGSALLVVRP